MYSKIYYVKMVLLCTSPKFEKNYDVNKDTVFFFWNTNYDSPRNLISYYVRIFYCALSPWRTEKFSFYLENRSRMIFIRKPRKLLKLLFQLRRKEKVMKLILLTLRGHCIMRDTSIIRQMSFMSSYVIHKNSHRRGIDSISFRISYRRPFTLISFGIILIIVESNFVLLL